MHRIRSLTPPQAAGNALAMHVQPVVFLSLCPLCTLWQTYSILQSFPPGNFFRHPAGKTEKFAALFCF
jgi:hypothetical protein